MNDKTQREIFHMEMICGTVWSGLVWSGLVWSGLVWSGLVWSGMVALMLVLFEVSLKSESSSELSHNASFLFPDVQKMQMKGAWPHRSP
ncbi:hypothetical protein INR49_018394 [Caranx melampygus]|nr:hypothetical protein INR49_018394 [Caranx melampygus]